MTKRKIEVSVIMPSYNSEKHICRSLQALHNQQTAIPYEIIVFDSSEDGTQKIIKESFPNVKLIESQKRVFAGQARNLAIQQSSGKVYAFIDSDCVAHPQWLERGVKSLEKKTIVGGAIRNGTTSSVIGTADYLLTFNEFLPSWPAREIKHMASCNLFCKKELFDSIGGFPNMWPGEDTIFTMEARKRTKLYYNPELIVTHHNRISLINFIKHHTRYGKLSSIVRKEIELPGSFLAKRPWLSPLAPFARCLSIGHRITIKNNKLLPKFVLYSPTIALGLISWGYGFVKESWKVS